jgi:hypothetical protein
MRTVHNLYKARYLIDKNSLCWRENIDEVNGVRVPRKSQVKSLSFFEAKLPFLPLERHFFEIDIEPT